MRRTSFSIGRRWRVAGSRGQHRRDYPFDFVIIGPPIGDYGTTGSERYRLCRIEVVGHGEGKCDNTCFNGIEADYSTAHLKKYGVLLEEK